MEFICKQGPAEVWFQFIVVLTAAILAVIVSIIVDKARSDYPTIISMDGLWFLMGCIIILFKRLEGPSSENIFHA